MLGFCFFVDDVIMEVDYCILAEVIGPWAMPSRHQTNEPLLWLKVLLETRLYFKSIEPLIVFLASLDLKLLP